MLLEKDIDRVYHLDMRACRLELPRFAGRVAKGYAAFFFSKQSSNASGVS
jgi:hypothetical protein